MKHPNSSMLVRIAQGDAYGMSCEYIKLPRDQATYDSALKFKSYGRHPTHRLRPGQYTDDTQMSIAVSEVLLSMGPYWKSESSEDGSSERLRSMFAESFVSCFKRDERDGYARGFQALLEQVKDGKELLATIRPDSDKNGAAMRSVPIGVLPDPEDVRHVASVQARITHDTPGGIASSVAVALMSHYALHEPGPLSDLPGWIAERVSGMGRWDGGPVQGPGVGMATARAVLTLVSEERSLLDVARRTIEWGGDTDSVLAVAWGIASTRMGDRLPEFFDAGMEYGEYGFLFLSQLGEKLMWEFS